MKLSVILGSIILLFSSCEIRLVGYNEFYNIDDPEDLPSGSIVTTTELIRLKAYYAAEYYLASELNYEIGGDDIVYVPPYRSRGIDCSGLMVNIFKYAVEGTNYALPFNDATADGFYKNYSDYIETPKKGDLIFWLNSSGDAYHIAILEKIENNRYYFIESNEFDGVDGMNYRSLSIYTTFEVKVKRLRLVDYSS